MYKIMFYLSFDLPNQCRSLYSLTDSPVKRFSTIYATNKLAQTQVWHLIQVNTTCKLYKVNVELFFK